jgi:hypothetical protein
VLKKHITEREIEGIRRRGIKRKQIRNSLKDKRRYCGMKGRTRSGSAKNSLWKRLQNE